MANQTFDYVIVGAGSAGCVLANRLSADPANNVCLIEAGPPDRNMWIHIPAGTFRLLFHKVLDWRFTSTPQPGANNNTFFINRGRALGGSSSINGMVYARGHRLDYDEWAALGCPGWSYREVLPYFRKSENNETFGETPYHGAGGPLNVSDVRERNPMNQVFLDAVSSLQLPRNNDINGAQQEGFGTRQVTIRAGRRESAATAFLDPAKARQNLTVVTGVLADKVVMEGRRAAGIELVSQGGRRRIDARKEIILSAGAIGSPMILMRSGIGPADELAKFGIPVVHALEGVGRNLQDHVGAFVKFMSNTTVPYGFSPAAVPRLAWQSLRYILTRRGFWASNIMESAGFWRSEPGLERPDLQFMFLPGHRGDAGQFFAVGHGFSLTSVVLRPKSRGFVSLTGPAPDAAPHIDPRFFSEEEDLDLLLKGIKLARRILDTPAFDAYRAEEVWPGPGITEDHDLREAIRDVAMTVFHPTCTCRMGSDDGAVVDPQLRVRGVDGLRVVDGSIMPRIVGGNTNAPIIMIGEKGADMILGKPPLPAAEF